jgi:hypothetical protein
VEAKVQLKSSIPIHAKVEISPTGFTLGVKDEIQKIFSICPKLLMNAELHGLVLAPRLKKDPPSPCIEDEPNSRPLKPYDWPHSLLQLGLSGPPITLT